MSSLRHTHGSRSERMYGVILHLYPPAFRERFEPEMRSVFAQMLEDEPRLRVWLRTILELPGNLIAEHVSDIVAASADGRIPRINIALLVAGVVLLAPGALVFSLGLLGSMIAHDHGFLQTVAGGFASSRQTLLVELIVLPLIAAFVNVLPLSLHVKRHGMSLSYASVRESALNALLAAAAISLVAFLLLHDAVHCVVQNPLTTATHLRQTLSCIQSS
ncbi:MAG TPA: hypothetical protein VHA78_06060 [Candidatus Peribacteraceae bacterium]|nr:hypothetical protein [Candidatus Peribacteraceae bacterium]